ncbi:MAG: hypothetical protein KDC67_05050, partial [Ignavibacteriae bacterium]|nr:hypothetical protein [Ignavibacteriota bacterium]
VATDNHKLVSDALDIGQLLFNFDKHQNDLQLIEWNKERSLNNLLNGNPSQKHLGNTLKLFLQQDRKQYNFSEFENIYILLYKHKIIGGTSPRTLFFAAPNALETEIKFGQDTMLDDMLLPLYRRDAHYIKYLVALSKSHNFNQFFPEFNSYIIKTIDKIYETDLNLHQELMTFDPEAYLKSLNGVLYNNNLGQPLEVINGLFLKQFEKDSSLIESKSDFVIKASKVVEGTKPLVLPVEVLNLPYIYTEDKWDSKTKVPCEVNMPLNQRQLPDQGDKYPYLTMNDFLTESIIKLPYKIDSDKFLTIGDEQYLIPLQPLFFNYFSTKDLLNGNLIKIKELAGSSVQVELNIPIKKGFISYTKIYNLKSNISSENRQDKGRIIEKSFAMALYPFNKSEQTKINYTVGLADIYPDNSNKLSVQLFKDSNINVITPRKVKERSNKPYITSQTIVNEGFDAMAVTLGSSVNYVIPLWEEYTVAGGDAYKFAIDFGTTNTHIEYAIEGQGSAKAFNISEIDEQIAFLMPANTPRRTEAIRVIDDGESHLMQEIIPKRIGGEAMVKSPFRSCLVQNSNVNYELATFTFADANIGFEYEKKVIRPYLKTFTNLKWSNEANNEKQVKHYIEEILMLCKNKVLKNNGDLSQTKIIWFYPVSMTTNHLKRFRRIWEESFEEIFNISEDNLSDFPESLAPFYHYKSDGNIRTSAKPSVSIDIGGGTTDVMIYFDEKPQLITSFKFAGNAIFGNGFNGNINANGFVQKFKEQIKHTLTQNKLVEEINILEKIYSDYQSSTDLINFLFSLEGNKHIKEKHLDIDFSKKLSDDNDFKIIFLLFYASIVYHVAELMKLKGIEHPRNIVFSGTGSKTLKIIDSSRKLDSLTTLFESIFNKVYDVSDSKLTLKTKENPKEVTCKGGFNIDDELNGIKHTDLIEINIGNYENPKVQSKAAGIKNTICYNDVDNAYLNDVAKNVNKFYEIFNELVLELDFKGEFGVSNKSIEIFNKIKSYDQLDYLMQGVKSLTEDSTPEEPVAQSLFFFPLIGLMYDLASAINES